MANDSYKLANEERAMYINQSGQLKWLRRVEWASEIEQLHKTYAVVLNMLLAGVFFSLLKKKN